MSKIVRCGLIQLSNPLNDETRPVAEIQKAMLDKHLPWIEKAGEAGVQMLGLQEIFNGPYFCPSQDRRWYAAAEEVPGPTTETMSAYARRYNMVMVVPVYERAMRGLYYNTAAVIDADGRYLGKYRKQHIPQVAGFWEKFFFTPGNGGYPVFETRYAKVGVYICYDRHFPEGARALGLNGAEIVFNPVGDRRRALSKYLWKIEQPAHAVANGYFVARQQPRRHRGALEHRQVLRHQLLRGSARADRRRGQRGRRRAGHRRPRSRPDRRGPQHLAVLPGPSSRRVPGPHPTLTFFTSRASDLQGVAAMAKLIRGGTVVNADGERRADVYIVGEHVVAVGTGPPRAGRDARSSTPAGAYVMPGGIDPHTHMELPFMGTVASEDFFTGTAAGARRRHDDHHRLRHPRARRSRCSTPSTSGAAGPRRPPPTTRFHVAVTWWDETRARATWARWRRSTASTASSTSWPTRTPSWPTTRCW